MKAAKEMAAAFLHQIQAVGAFGILEKKINSNVKIKVTGDRQRMYALECVEQCEQGSVVSISRPKRSLDQNARMWAMIADIARCEPEGRQWTQEAWKHAFMHSLGHQVQFAMALDNSGPFPVGFKTSALTVPQMTDLITVIQEYGDRHGVEWRDVANQGWNDD